MKGLFLLSLVAISGYAYAQVTVSFQSINIAGAGVSSSSGLGLRGAFGFYGAPNSGFYTFPRAQGGVSIDFTPPTVQTAPSAFALVEGGAEKLQIVATDPSGISSIQLYYRPIASPDGNKNYQRASIDFLGNNTYGIDVPDLAAPQNWYDQMGMEYYFEARDNASNVTRYPSKEQLYAYLKKNSPHIPDDRLSFGNKLENYRIFSIPYDLTDNSIRNLFGAYLGLPDHKTYRIYDYEGIGFREYPDFTGINRGKGYFIIIKDQATLGFSNEQTAPPNHRGQLYQLLLKPGWNLIGNPYTVAINWNDVKTLNNIPSLSDLYVYEGGFSNRAELNSFEGAFVYLDGSTEKMVTIPFKGQTLIGGREQPEFTNDLTSDRWLLKLNIEQAQMKNHINSFGMHPSANISKDVYDNFSPPSPFTNARLIFPHPESGQKNFSSDIVPPVDEYTWRFDVESSDADTYISLSWEMPSRVGDRQLYLFDADENTVIDMKSDSSYVFKTLRTKNFKIYYGKDILGKIAPDNTQLYRAHPNPFNFSSPVTFEIGVAENLSSINASLLVTDNLGRTVYQSNHSLDSGVRSITWNGVSNSGDILADGVYFYRIDAGENHFSGKILLVK